MTNDGDGVSVKCFSTAGIYYDIYIYIYTEMANFHVEC